MLKVLFRTTAIASVIVGGTVCSALAQDAAPMKPADAMSNDAMKPADAMKSGDAMSSDAMKPGDAMSTDAMKPGDAMSSDAMKPGDAMSTDAMKPADAMSTDAMKPADAMKTDAMATDAMASDMPMVGGAPMDPAKTIVENASQAKNLTTLVAAVKAAGLVETLSGPGPFTVFAPTNAAFEKLPAGTVETLLKPENKDMLVKILTYHVVPAKATAEVAMQMIKDDGGVHDAKTVEGAPIALRMNGKKLVVIDQKGGGAVVEQADVLQSNGVVHVIDSVLMPK